MKPKEILLLIVIIAAGVLFYHVQTGKIQIDWGEGLFFDWTEHTFEETFVLDLPAPEDITIVNALGEVEVRGAETDMITVQMEKRIRRGSEEEASRVASELTLIRDYTERGLRLTSNREEFRRKNFRIAFRIEVPSNASVHIENSRGGVQVVNLAEAEVSNRHGEVYAQDIAGDLLIENSYEDVTVRSVEADCRIVSRHSNVTLDAVRGRVHITHRHGRIRIENIEGPATLLGSHSEIDGYNLRRHCEIETSYEKVVLEDLESVDIMTRNSPVQIRRSRGDVSITDTYDRITLEDIGGRLQVEGKSIRINGKGLYGPSLSVKTTYDDVDLAGFSGRTDIDVSNGNVTLSPSALESPMTIQGRSMNVTFYWPRTGTASLEARTKNGEILWELSTPPSEDTSNGERVIRAFTGVPKAAPRVLLKTTYGTIRILESEGNRR